MRAAVIERFGDRRRPRDPRRADPEPGPGEVTVRVTAAGLNNFDLQIRRERAGFPIPLAVRWRDGGGRASCTRSATA